MKATKNNNVDNNISKMIMRITTVMIQVKSSSLTLMVITVTTISNVLNQINYITEYLTPVEGA